MRDLRGKLSLRVRFCETCDVYHITSFELSEPRRKQDGKVRVLAPHFSDQFDSRHPWHRVVRYQKVSSQTTFEKTQRLLKAAQNLDPNSSKVRSSIKGAEAVIMAERI